MPVVLGIAFVIQAFFWWVSLGQTQRHRLGAGIVAVDAFFLACLVVLLVLLARFDRTAVGLILLLLATFSAVVAIFSRIYWGYGGPSNFTRPLTHLDSVYFALGTLSTAGSGTLAATSESARAIQTVQMAIDVPLTLIAVAAVIARFATQFRTRA